jgi:glycosyltransferase involved in cell wall biosynthesis
VAEQTYPYVEHLVIDGASTDGTLEILQSNRQQLSVLVSEPDKGLYHAMNKGIVRCNGDIIGFLNADDFYAHNNVLESVVQCFEDEPTLEACFADLVYVKKLDTSRSVRYWHSNDFVPHSFAEGWCPPHPTFFARRSVYERLGAFDLNYRIAADVELMMRFLEVHKIRVGYVPEVWVKMRMGGTTNKSFKNVWSQNREVLCALKNHKLSVNPWRFFAYKLWSRGLQFVRRPTQ